MPRTLDTLIRLYRRAIASGDRAAAIILFGRIRAEYSAAGQPAPLRYRWTPDPD